MDKKAPILFGFLTFVFSFKIRFLQMQFTEGRISSLMLYLLVNPVIFVNIVKKHHNLFPIELFHNLLFPPSNVEQLLPGILKCKQM